MRSLWCKKDAECTKMVIKKVLDNCNFTKKFSVHTTQSCIQEWFGGVKDGGKTENMWGQAVIKVILIKQVLFQTIPKPGGVVSLPAPQFSFPSALDFIIAAKHEKTASFCRKIGKRKVSLQGLFCEFFHFHNSKQPFLSCKLGRYAISAFGFCLLCCFKTPQFHYTMYVLCM